MPARARRPGFAASNIRWYALPLAALLLCVLAPGAACAGPRTATSDVIEASSFPAAFAPGAFDSVTSALSKLSFLDGSAESVAAADVYNPQFGGYLAWSAGQRFSADGSTSPHGGYSATTNKCAVCHAPHRANKIGTVLTAWSGVGDVDGMRSTASCLFCHGPSATFSGVRIVAEHDGPFTLSPHGSCAVCHTASPHGAYVSKYAVLSRKLLNSSADSAIDADLADPDVNGLTADLFDMSDPGKAAHGGSLAVGYLCSNCHRNSEGQAAFAVNSKGARPTMSGSMAYSTVTGHQVWVQNATTLNDDGSYGTSDPGASSTQSRLAFNPALGCTACHDAKDASGRLAFPHGYVDGQGRAVSIESTQQGAFCWITVAADADDSRTVAARVPAEEIEGLPTKDGMCLKCHISPDRTHGVGLTF